MQVTEIILVIKDVASARRERYPVRLFTTPDDTINGHFVDVPLKAVRDLTPFCEKGRITTAVEGQSYKLTNLDSEGFFVLEKNYR